MSDPAFSLNLGNGVYMDSDGALRNGPVPNKPVIAAPFTLPVDPKKIKDALSSVKDALTDINKRGFVHDKWGKVDEIDKILDILAGIGKLAGYIAPAAAALGILVDALKLFGVLKDGPDHLETLINQRLDELGTHVHALAQLLQTTWMVAARSGIHLLSETVRNHVERLPNSDPSPEDLKREFDRLMGAHNTQAQNVLVATDLGSWRADFQRREHTRIWPMLAGILHVVPGVPTGAAAGGGSGTQPVAMPSDGLSYDHRLMFPFVSYAVETYLACIRGISPEYRTTGEFRAQLRDFATRLSDLAMMMRNWGLARTIYTAAHFNQVFYEQGGYLRIPHAHSTVGPFPVAIPLEPEITPDCSFWVVGAMDLRYHDDTYFHDFLARLAAADFQVWTNPDQAPKPVTRCGTLNLRWIPPARLVPGGPGPGNYVIANREECAAAANAQSETDYANLLAISGYPELMRLSALCRNEAAAPDASQTVKPKKPSLYVNPQPETTVTVKSNPVRYTGEIITATAKRAFQEFMGKVKVQTQSVLRADPIKYRVVLRTLHSLAGTNGWRDVQYSEFQICTYENDPNNPGFKRLKVVHGSGESGSVSLVGQPTASPRVPIHLEGTAAILATTFDWWVPTKPAAALPHDDYVEHLGAAMIDPWKLPGTGAYELPDLTTPLYYAGFGDGTQLGPSIPELTWPKVDIPPDSQRRDVRQETVHLRYELDWNREQLQLTVWNQLSERNFIVYLVLEELMPDGSGNVLHTAVELPVCGLVTRVPQQFFIDEFAAHAKTAKIIASLVPKHIPQVGDIVPDEGVAWIRPGDLLSPGGVEWVMARLQTGNPAFFAEVLMELKLRNAAAAHG